MDTSNKQASSKHTMELITAASPYLNRNARRSFSTLLKASELIDMIQGNGDVSELETCDIKEGANTTEAMLLNIRDVCNNSEREFVDTFINMFKAQKLFQAYRVYTSENVSLEAQSAKSNSSGFSNPFSFLGNKNMNMMDFLMSQLTPEQKSTMESVKMMMSMMGTPS